MTNYKEITRFITVGGVQHPVPPDATIVTLYENINNSTSTDTFLDFLDNQAYKPFTGKKFKLIGLTLSLSLGAGQTFSIGSGTTIDTIITTYITFTIARVALLAKDYVYEIYMGNDNWTMPDTDYLMHSGQANLEYIQAIGYEETA